MNDNERLTLPAVEVPRPADMPPTCAHAAKRVVDRAPIPRLCEHCGSPTRLVNNSVIYGKSYGDWPWAYQCTNRSCGAYVGLHPGTDIPLGTLATAEMRAARKQAKAEFEPLWQSRRLSRTQAYALLAEKMGVPVNECHFGWFSVEQCRQAAIAAREILDERGC